MSDKFESKYRKISDSFKLELSLENYILLPDSRVKCIIFLKPKYNIKLGVLNQEIIIKLTQFEKCEFKKGDDTLSKEKETLLFKKIFVKHFPDIIDTKILFKDIEFEVPSSSNSLFFPTFEYRKAKTINFSELKYLNIESIETIFQKKIIISGFPLNTEEKEILDKKSFKNIKSDQKIIKFNTQLKIENKNITELSQKEIERYSDFDENLLERDDNRKQLTPSMESKYFKCEYKIEINIVLNNICRKTINKFFKICIYDIYNINIESIPENLKHYFLIKENEFFEPKKSLNEENINDEEKNNTKKKDETNLNEFEIIDHEDFISTIEGKNK